MIEYVDFLSCLRNDPDLFNSMVLCRPPYWSRQCEAALALPRYREMVVLSEGVGRNKGVVLALHDYGILQVEASNTMGLPATALTTSQMMERWHVPQRRISYDRGGIGREFPLHLSKYGITQAMGYHGEARPCNPKIYTNRRSEGAYWLRLRLQPGTPADARRPEIPQRPFHIPQGPWWPKLREELAALTFDEVGTQTRLIKKEDLEVKLGRSPDLADALIQAFSFPKGMT